MIKIIDVIIRITGITSAILLGLIYITTIANSSNLRIEKKFTQFIDKINPMISFIAVYWWIIAAIIHFILRKFVL